MRDDLPSRVGLCVGDSAAVLTLLPSLGLRTLEEKVALPDSSLSKSKSRYTEREIVNQKETNSWQTATLPYKQKQLTLLVQI